MNRSQLLNQLAERNEWTRREADAFLTSFTDLITASVAKGEDVAISGFAKFRRIDRPARMARNPATGEQVRVKAGRQPTPSAAIIDSQSVKTTQKGGRVASMGARRSRGASVISWLIPWG